MQHPFLLPVLKIISELSIQSDISEHEKDSVIILLHSVLVSEQEHTVHYVSPQRGCYL